MGYIVYRIIQDITGRCSYFLMNELQYTHMQVSPPYVHTLLTRYLPISTLSTVLSRSPFKTITYCPLVPSCHVIEVDKGILTNHSNIQIRGMNGQFCLYSTDIMFPFCRCTSSDFSEYHGLWYKNSYYNNPVDSQQFRNLIKLILRYRCSLEHIL